MISDVLSQALDDIERYQRGKWACYDSIRDWIDSVKEAMEDLLVHFDAPPIGGPPEFERVEGDVGHYVSAYGMGRLIHCWVHRTLRTVEEARNNPALHGSVVTIDIPFRYSKEGVAREAVEMAEKLRSELPPASEIAPARRDTKSGERSAGRKGKVARGK